MKIYRKIIEIIIYTLFTAILLSLGAMIVGLLISGLVSIYSFLF